MDDLNSRKPLQGMLVLDFSQFLSGPSASLRLADLGARVIKIERQGIGDICRTLYISNVDLAGDSTLFHAINRNKESFAVDLKNDEDLAVVKRLIANADVMIANFRPGVMERLGLDYESTKELNPSMIYGEVTGYGHEGPWRDKPGQDLLVQSVSGLAWLNGDAGQPPMPFGLAVADMMAGAQLAQGILACLVRRGVTGQGGFVQASLLEATLDFQSSALTTYLNGDGRLPERSGVHNANAYLGAPYGIYGTKDGYIALATGSVTVLGELIGCDALSSYCHPQDGLTKRDEIKNLIAEHLKTESNDHWLSLLEPASYECSDVMTWDRLFEHEGFKTLRMTQSVSRKSGANLLTTRCPIRIDGERFKSPIGSPTLGEDNDKIREEIDHR